MDAGWFEVISHALTALGSLGAGVAATYFQQRKVHRRALTAATMATVRASHHSLPSVDAGGRRVLLLEDEPYAIAVLRKILEGMGLVVDHARTLKQGRELAGTHAYALVIADLKLPDGDGAALLGELGPRKLVYSGASAEELDRVRALQVADWVLPKSGDLSEFEATVAELLRLSNP